MKRFQIGLLAFLITFTVGTGVMVHAASSTKVTADIFRGLPPSGTFTFFNGGNTQSLFTSTDTIVGRATTDTLTNKGIDADDNTITDIDNNEIKAAAGIVYSKLTLTDSILNADINSAAGIVDTKLATISTAGKVSNSATTATSANTASAIVARDGSGNFSAGTITATLSGNATNVTGTVAIANGGTGQTSQTNAYDALSPNTTKGDLVVHNGSDNVRLPVGANTFVLTADSAEASGVKWAAAAGGGSQDSSYELSNLGLAGSVGSNALTIALKTKSGSDASGGSPVLIAFRNATAATGQYTQRSVTGALSVVVSSGSTLGQVSAAAEYVYVYAIDNSGTVELAVSTQLFVDEGSVYSTTAEGGAGGADSRNVLYSTTARSNVPIRLIGRIKSTQTTAGTWASAPSEISLAPFNYAQVTSGSTKQERIVRLKVGTAVCSADPCTIASQTGEVTSVQRISQASYRINFAAGTFSETPTCTIACHIIDIANVACSGPSSCNGTCSPSATIWAFNNASSGADVSFDVICIGPR